MGAFATGVFQMYLMQVCVGLIQTHIEPRVAAATDNVVEAIENFPDLVRENARLRAEFRRRHGLR